MLAPSWLQLGSSWPHVGPRSGSPAAPEPTQIPSLWPLSQPKPFQIPSLWPLSLPNPHLCPTFVPGEYIYIYIYICIYIYIYIHVCMYVCIFIYIYIYTYIHIYLYIPLFVYCCAKTTTIWQIPLFVYCCAKTHHRSREWWANSPICLPLCVEDYPGAVALVPSLGILFLFCFFAPNKTLLFPGWLDQPPWKHVSRVAGSATLETILETP